MVEQAVVECVAKSIPGIEGINHQLGVVNRVDVGAIDIQRQRAIETFQCCPNHTAGAAVFLVAGPYSRDRAPRRACEIVAISRIHITVVADHIADGITAWGAITGATSFDGIADVISGQGCIVGSGDRDRQDADVGEGTVGDGVVEGFAQEGAGIERINRRIGIVDHIDIRSIGLERDRSVEATQRHTNRAGSAGAFA